MSYLKCFSCEEDLGWDKDDYKGSNNVGDMPICVFCDVWYCGDCYITAGKMKAFIGELSRHAKCRESVDLV